LLEELRAAFFSGAGVGAGAWARKAAAKTNAQQSGTQRAKVLDAEFARFKILP
jgi:hypothetical protein